MNQTPDRLLVDWLTDGPDQGPRHGLERTLAATRRTNQRPGWTFASTWVPAPAGDAGNREAALLRPHPRRRAARGGACRHGAARRLRSPPPGSAVRPRGQRHHARSTSTGGCGRPTLTGRTLGRSAASSRPRLQPGLLARRDPRRLPDPGRRPAAHVDLRGQRRRDRHPQRHRRHGDHREGGSMPLPGRPTAPGSSSCRAIARRHQADVHRRGRRIGTRGGPR